MRTQVQNKKFEEEKKNTKSKIQNFLEAASTGKLAKPNDEIDEPTQTHYAKSSDPNTRNKSSKNTVQLATSADQRREANLKK